jgi:pyruvate kinase
MANALDHLNAGRTRIEWLSQLNTEYHPAKNYRRTTIICTIGPCALGALFENESGSRRS